MIRLLTRKTLFNNQVEHIYPNIKSDWYVDPYCHACREVRGVQVPESLNHALVECPTTKSALRSSFISFNIAGMPIENNSAGGDSLIWLLNGRVLGPCQKNSNRSQIVNAISWLTHLEILNFKHQKKVPTDKLIFDNVKVTLIRLANKNPRIPILKELLMRGSMPFHNPRPPEAQNHLLPILDG